MARTRRLPVSLAVCAGVLLLVSGAIAETIETSRRLLDKVDSLEQYSEPRADDRPVAKVSSAEESVATVSPLTDDRKSNDALSVEELENLERKGINATAVSDASEPQGLKRAVHSEGSLTPGLGSNTSKAEESSEGSSTRANAEDTSRLTRTNDLATVTVKPPPEESGDLQDDKPEKNKQQEQAKDTGATVAPATSTKLNSHDEVREEGGAETNTERSLPFKLESASSLSSGSSAASPKEKNLKEEEIEVVTSGGSFPESPRGPKEAGVPESENSEVHDLEKEESTTISLINDTNVNYPPRTNNSTASGGRTGPSENSTNSVYGESSVSHGRVGPKEEVEVVRNVTQSPVQKMVATEPSSEQAEGSAGRNESESNPPGSGEQTVVEANKEKLDGRAELVKGEQGISGRAEDDQSKAADIGSNRGNREDEQTISTGDGSQAGIPRGRTIAFSLVNEFPNLESKATSASKEIDLPSTKKISSSEKGLEQKPYPYLKSTVTQSGFKLTNRNNEGARPENSTTEEGSPLENTIVRGDGEKKMIVTEPSVVLENSIQQFKPDHSEKSENDSSNNSTSSQAAFSSTTQLLPEAGPTNGTLIDVGGPGESRRLAASAAEEKSTSASGNDIPQGGEVITTKDGGFDVTGNGITEVTGKPDSPNKDSSGERPFHMANQTTQVPLISSSSPHSTRAKITQNAEMQTDVEESLLIRSTLNASETSTEFPLTRDRPESQRMTVTTFSMNPTTPDPSNSTALPAASVNSTTNTTTTTEKSVAESIDGRDTNGTNEIPTGVETATVMNKETSTSEGVEYKFVGLTDATTTLTENVTEGIVRENATEVAVTGLLRTTMPGIEEISTKEYSMEDSTIAPDVTENLADSEIGSTATYDTTTAATTEESLLASTIPPATTDSKLEDSTALPSYENQTERAATSKDEQEFKVTTLTESLATTTETFATVMETEGPPASSETKATINMTERPNGMTGTTWIIDATTVMTTEDIETTTATPASPILPPRVFGPSTPGDVTTQETTEVVLNLSPEEITSLVQIVIQGSWHEVCPQLDALRTVLAELLTAATNNLVRAEQIIVHQNPCRDTPPSTPTPTDTPLMSILVYVVDEEGKFDSTTTNMLPSLYSPTTRFPVTIHSFRLVQEKDSGNAIAVVVVSSVAFICLVLLAGLLFIMRKRQTRFNYGERCRPVSLDAFSLDSVSAYNSVRRKGAVRASKRSYGNPTFEDSSAIPSHPLNFASLSTFCSDVNAINEEFAGIPQVSAKIDELPAGAEVKNRYANVIPLPETRVPLQKINNDPLSEYINASYVRGPRNATRYYIACQAPMETSVTDFWRMIWEQQSKVIIMLTDLVENDVEKCTEYIPPSEVTDCHRLYGDYQVTLKKRETKEKYAISTLHLKNLENNTFREVYHIWYLWPVNGVQSDGAGLIAVILEARALQRAGPGPIVVHCSPGTGRTGTLIALDLGIRQYEITRTVDVPRVVYTIRRDRAGAVQTKEQYAFIYKALNLYATKLAGGGGLEST